MKWICYLIGHDCDPDAPCYVPLECARCGAAEDLHDYRTWFDSRGYPLRWACWVAALLVSLRWWFRPCYVCGCRFGRCSEDCIPF